MNKIDPNLEWLIKNKKLVRIEGIERKLKMPLGTLKKYVTGVRSLPSKWHDSVVKKVKELRGCKK